jgi:hypothetical protein
MSANLKYIIVGLSVLILAVIAFVVYRMFFEFNLKAVQDYVKAEAAKYPAGSQADVYNTIMEGCQYILSNHSLTNQVLTVAKAAGINKEQELVFAAVNQCKAFNYIKA